MGYDPVVAQDLAPALGVDADGDDYGDRNAAPGLAHLHVGGVQPKSRPVAFQGAPEEGPDIVVDLHAEPRCLAPEDTRYSHRLDWIVDEPIGMPLMWASWITAVSAFSAIRQGSSRILSALDFYCRRYCKPARSLCNTNMEHNIYRMGILNVSQLLRALV